jgi:hypothetical protein
VSTKMVGFEDLSKLGAVFGSTLKHANEDKTHDLRVFLLILGILNL